MHKNMIKKSPRLIALALFLSLLLIFPSSCLISGEKDEAELMEDLLQKVAAMDGEMTFVTKEGDNVTITITKSSSTEGQAEDITEAQPKNTEVDKESTSSVAPTDILPSLESIEDVFKVLGVWEDAHTLREKGLSWSHVAAELGYNKDTMYAELLEIAEVRLKDAKEAGLISQEQMEKKFAYFSEIALKWVHKIFADTYEEEIKKFEGTIKAIDGHLWKVSVEDELWIVDVSEATVIREPEVGLRAFIVGIEKGDVIIALEAEIEVVEKEDKIIDFDGIIKLIDSHIWKVNVEDELWIVDVSEASIRVDPRVELRVAVAGIVKDNYILALEIDEAEEQH